MQYAKQHAPKEDSEKNMLVANFSESMRTYGKIADEHSCSAEHTDEHIDGVAFFHDDGDNDTNAPCSIAEKPNAHEHCRLVEISFLQEQYISKAFQCPRSTHV